MITQKSLINDLTMMDLKANDNIMIHSSLRAIGCDGEVILQALTKYFNEGLLIFPTHTWEHIREDLDVFDVNNSDSCVGTLTNLARKYPGFNRSNHPTHSVAAHGEGSLAYLALDNNPLTPASISGCHGVLKDIGAKILFIGVPLSKNTFIHSIEEFMEVPLRFTCKTYHFKTITADGQKIDNHCYRHFNEKCPHISDNYEKLLPYLLQYGIAYEGQFGLAKVVVVDAFKCFYFVKRILIKDINAFSDLRDISQLM